MKKILLLLCFCISGYRALCQKIDVGILAAPNVSEAYFPGSLDFSEKTTYSAVWGVHAGAFLQVATGSFYIQPGLLYESIGGKINSSYDEFDGSSKGIGAGTSTYWVQYLQLPLNILYHTKSGKFFLGGGPYVALGISGSTSSNDNYVEIDELGGPSINNNTATSKSVFNSSNNVEFGGNIVAGVHVPGNFIFTSGFGIGKNNTVYSLSVGRLLW